MPIRRLVLFAVVASLAVPAPAQNAVIRSSVREVVLDVTVRNKNEKLVRDLRADEVDVYVDGVKQELRTFQLVRGEETRKLESSAPMVGTSIQRAEKLPPPNSAREINMVALVFRTSNTEQRARAEKAALAFIQGEARPNTYIALLTLSITRTRVVQPFTANTELLEDGVRRTLSNFGVRQPGATIAALTAPGAPPSVPVRGSGETTRNIDATNAASSTLDASVATGVGASKVAELDSEGIFTDANTLGRFEMDRYREILNQMASMPGRKTVVSMTSSLSTPAEEQEVFRKLIADARKMGVTFYGVNLNGLTPSSSMSQATTSTKAVAAISPTQGNTPSVSREQATQDERILYSVTAADQENALRVLAESTGGMMISNTNDIANQMPRIMNEVNTHYELSWTPTGERYDGKFHKIEVKLKRAGLHATCRDGYYGLPDLNGREFQAFEMTGIRTLDRNPLPKDFEFRASALRFGPAANGGWHGVIAFEAPIATFASIDPGMMALDSQMQVLGTAVALVKDVHEEIAGMVSDNVSYSVPSEKKDEFLAGNLTMTLPIDLQPGVWTVEATMMSTANRAASAKRIAVYVPKPGTPSISSISLVRRIEPRTASTGMLGPFDIGGSRVTPTLANSIPNGAESELYFVLYPSSEIAERPKVVVQYFRDGRLVGNDAPAVPADDGQGRIPMLSAAKLTPGDYEVRATVTQGAKASRETAWIRVDQ
ncbi:MAG TPA: VWA domain-containing protein [Bryobacteraceae bacterium]